MGRKVVYRLLVMLAVAGCCSPRSISQPSLATPTSSSAPASVVTAQPDEPSSAPSTVLSLPRRAAAGGAAVQRASKAAVSTASAVSSTEDAQATSSPQAANVTASEASAVDSTNKRVGHPIPAAGHPASTGPRAPVPPRRPELGTLLNGTAFVPGACGPKPSSLGYQCSWAGPNGVILHWSYNVTHPPINRCTTNNAVPNAEARNNVTWLGDIGMHFALQVATRVKLHLGFVGPSQRYYPSEGVHTGVYCNGADCNKAKLPQVQISYHASPSISVVTGNRALRDPSIMEGWAAWASSDFDGLTGVLCLSRRANSSQLKVGATIGSEVTMSYAVNSKTPYTYKAPRLGMVKIDFSTGTAAVVQVPRGAIRAHGALMILAFALLLPAGLLSCRHSWLFVEDGKGGGLSPLWLLLHVGLMVSGVLLGLAGMIVALVSFGSDAPGAASSAHQVLGLIAVGLSLLLVVLYGVRPFLATAPGHATPLLAPLKLAGVLTVATSWAALFVGCVVARDLWAIPLHNWASPCALLCGLMTAAAIALELRYQKLVRTGSYNPRTHTVSNLNPLPMARIRTHREPYHTKKELLEELLSPGLPYSNDGSSGGSKSPIKGMMQSSKGALVHVLAAVEGRLSSSGGSTPRSVTYRGRSSMASGEGMYRSDSGFPSTPGSRLNETV